MLTLGIATIVMLRQVEFGAVPEKADTGVDLHGRPDPRRCDPDRVLGCRWLSGWCRCRPATRPSPDIFNIQPWFNFGRVQAAPYLGGDLSPSAGTALITTSFYVVQRTTRARLWGGALCRGSFFWGYQLFIVLAATGYLLGITEGREYAEPEWYVDLWLTIVWVAYLAVYLGTLLDAQGTAYLCGELVSTSPSSSPLPCCTWSTTCRCPSAFLGFKSYSAFSGVQDALTQW